MGKTLTEMLEDDMLDPYPIPDTPDKVKEIFKIWLKEVNLGGMTEHTLLVIESTRKLLITLVDEP